MLLALFSVPALAAALGCSDLEKEQARFLKTAPATCAEAKKAHAEYEAGAKTFLGKCRELEALAGKKPANEAELRHALQEFLDPPAMKVSFGEEAKAPPKECDSDWKPILAYRYRAQGVVSAVGAKLSAK